MKKQNYILYRIFYGNILVYVGRTRQPLQDRIRGHLFKAKMQRSIYIELVSRIEYSEFTSEADMNLYEIYFINLWKPSLNIDDKCKDKLTINLPDVTWKEFKTPLWSKWKREIKNRDDKYKMRIDEKKSLEELVRTLRRKWHYGEVSEDEYYRVKEALDQIK